MKSAEWSQESTFTKFYNKPVEHQGNLGLNSLRLYVVTTKIVSYSSMFCWPREHVTKAHSYYYISLLSSLSSHSDCFKISCDSVATNDQ